MSASTTHLLLAAPARQSNRQRIAGIVLTVLAALFLTMDAAMKLVVVPETVEATARLGWDARTIFGLGIVEAVLLVGYLVPRTAVLGALLWTAFLGGAVATHVRVADPLLSHTLFPVYVATLLWGALLLREPRLRAVLAPRK